MLRYRYTYYTFAHTKLSIRILTPVLFHLETEAQNSAHLSHSIMANEIHWLRYCTCLCGGYTSDDNISRCPVLRYTRCPQLGTLLSHLQALSLSQSSKPPPLPAWDVPHQPPSTSPKLYLHLPPYTQPARSISLISLPPRSFASHLACKTALPAPHYILINIYN